MTEITYRLADPSDLDALVALDAVCFPPSVAFPRYVMRAYAFARRSRTIIAEEERIAGFTIVRLLPKRIADVVTLDVDPSFRNRGIASELLRRGEEWMRENSVVASYLEVDCDNDSALRIYKRRGYAEKQEFLENGVRRFLMEKPFD